MAVGTRIIACASVLAMLFVLASAASSARTKHRTVAGEKIARMMVDPEDRELMMKHAKRHFSEHDVEMLRSINEEFEGEDSEMAKSLFEQLNTLLDYEAQKHEDALDGDEEIDADNMEFDPHNNPNGHHQDVFGKPIFKPSVAETYEQYGAVLDNNVRYIDQIEKVARYGLVQVVDLMFDQAMRHMARRMEGFVMASTDINVEQGMGGLQIVDRVETQRYEAGRSGHTEEWAAVVRDTFRIHIRREVLEHNPHPGENSHQQAPPLVGTGRPLIAIIERLASVRDPISIADKAAYYH
jgi:hypothetical protein